MAGRPTKLTEEVIRKLEEVAALDGSVEEMAYYAGVHVDTVYGWLQADTVFSERIRALRERPILKARQTIVKALDLPDSAKWYIERKKKKEFSTRVEQDITTAGDKLESSTDLKELSKRFDEFLKSNNPRPTGE